MIKPLLPARPREPEEFWPQDKKLYSGVGPIRMGDYPADAQVDAYIDNDRNDYDYDDRNDYDSCDCWTVLKVTLPEKTRNEKYEEEKSLYDTEMVVYEKKMIIYQQEMKAWTEHCRVQARLEKIKALEAQKKATEEQLVRLTEELNKC